MHDQTKELHKSHFGQKSGRTTKARGKNRVLWFSEMKEYQKKRKWEEWEDWGDEPDEPRDQWKNWRDWGDGNGDDWSGSSSSKHGRWTWAWVA